MVNIAEIEVKARKRSRQYAIQLLRNMEEYDFIEPIIIYNKLYWRIKD